MANSRGEPKLTECFVCHDSFKEPKILPCAHILCRECLVSWLQASTEALCPVCRSSIQDKTKPGSKHSQELVDSLPTDLTLEALVESTKLLDKDHVCFVCTNVAAVSMCLDCSEMFCRPCANAHGKMTISRHHVIKDLAKLTPESVAASRPVFCSEHPLEPSRLFCTAHNSPICLLCASSLHRSCPEVKDLSRQIDEARKSLQELDSKLKSVETSYDETIKSVEMQLSNFETSMRGAVSEIDEICERLRQSVAVCQRRLIDNVMGSFEEKKDVVMDTKQKLVLARGKVTSHRLLVQRISKSAPQAVIFDMVAMLKTRTGRFDVCKENVKDWTPIPVKSIEVDPKILAHIKYEIENLGSTTTSKPATTNSTPQKVVAHKFTKEDNTEEPVAVLSLTGYLKSNKTVSEEPMVMNHLYKIHVEGIGGKYKWIGAGILTENGGQANVGLHSKTEAWPPSVTIWKDCIKIADGMVVSNYGSELARIQIGSCVGVLVDSAYCLHLYIDGVDYGLAFRGVPQPCWAAFHTSRGLKVSRLTVQM